MISSTYLDMSQLSVAIVENNPFFRRILRSLLSGFGVRTIHEAAGTEDGWKLLEEHRPDVLIVDWNLGGEDGTALLEKVRRCSDTELAATRFIFVSAHSDRRHVLLGAKLGANDFIVKPLSARVLYERIRRLILSQSAYVRRNGRLEIVERPPARSAHPEPAPGAGAAALPSEVIVLDEMMRSIVQI
ncbi:response regulator [Methylobrevis albus]|uniref:Response regulator n=1 Tax=Methylobrevis albus TaxID=2793297 RepID=A0A931I537_9HYPH|nr:response regulator [Methylobrevis albus]MBH0238993.1 response regulator [Methylobrevis albus]